MWAYIGWKPKYRIKTSANLLSDRCDQTMLRLRKILCWCFGFLALNFLVVSIGTITALVRSTNLHGFLANSQHREVSAGVAVLLMLLSRLVLALPVVLGIVYGMAWWTVKQGKRSARGWSIAASIGMLLLSVPLTVASFYVVKYSPRASTEFLIFVGLTVALGVIGLVVFARRNSIEQGPLAKPKPPRVAGDGTSRFLDAVAWIVGVGGYFGGRYLWWQWGRANGMVPERGHSNLAVFLAALLIMALLHESGHAITGLSLGMKLRMFVVGPFQWRIRDGRWKFNFQFAALFSGGGATAVVPTNPTQPRWQEICMIAAGPLANLITGLTATYAALVARGQWYEQYWWSLTLFSTLSLAVFLMNLIPFRPEAAYSDGARIYQLIQGGPWADLHRAMSVVTSTSVTSLRPKDYDINAIQRAELSFTQGRHALLLRLFASSYFIDCGMISQARDAVAEAERIYEESASDVPAPLLTVFVFDTAYLRRDAVAARLWWDRMEAKKPTHFGPDYWLAKSALCWIEGNLDDAHEAWEKGIVLAQKLPAAGAYEFDRYRYALLHQCLEKEAAIAVS